MPLSNAQYNAIMRDYDRTRMRHLREQEEQTAAIISRSPALGETLSAIRSESAALARATLSGETTAAREHRERLSGLRRERDSLLAGLSLTPADLALTYSCPDCRDTGYVNGEKCHCFKQAAMNLLYTQSRLGSVLETDRFENFSLSFYSKEPNELLGGKSNYTHMEEVFGYCCRYAAAFKEGSESLLFSGTTGVGKTFLANCIAGEVLRAGNSVLSLSAIALFDLLSRQAFDGEAAEEFDRSELLDCDLLLIDDLGTEVANSFTISRLFFVVNSRLLSGKATVISTNLSMTDLRNIYSERISSRLLSGYRVFFLYGEDIRLLKRFSSR